MKHLKTFETFGGYSLDDVFMASDNPAETLEKILNSKTLDELEKIDMFIDDVIMSKYSKNKSVDEILEEIKREAKELYEYEYEE